MVPEDIWNRCKARPYWPIEAFDNGSRRSYAEPEDIMEYADCLILVFDATRRAGFSLKDLAEAAKNKLMQNKLRRYPRPVGDGISEHISEGNEYEGLGALVEKHPIGCRRIHRG